MAYEINRTLGWIGEALDRARGKRPGEASNPNLIPDIILPKVDVFGWEPLQRMRTAISPAVVGVEEVFPALEEDWPSVLGGRPSVPPGVALRIVTGVHIQHGPGIINLIMWFGVLDREGGSTGIPTETGTGTAIPELTPLCTIRPFYLRPGESFVGRVRGLPGADQITIVYTWIDLKEGEYINSYAS